MDGNLASRVNIKFFQSEFQKCFKFLNKPPLLHKSYDQVSVFLEDIIHLVREEVVQKSLNIEYK